MNFFKENYRVFVVFGIPLAVLFIVIVFHKEKPVKNEVTTSFKESFISPQNPEVIKKSISDVNNLVEIPDKSHAKVFEVVDVKSLRAKSPIFKKAYPHDFVVLLPDKTIIYDPSTKTVRDISSKVFYDELSN